MAARVAVLRGWRMAAVPALRSGEQTLLHLLLGIVATVCLIVAATAVAPLFGYGTYVIYGGSMGASLPRGSLAVTERVDTDGLRVGDVIAMKRHGSTTLHRITSVDIEDGQPVVTTWGDANEGPDAAPVILSGRGDRLMFSIPYLGYLLHFARGPLGRLLLIGVPLIALAVLLWREGRAPQSKTAAPGAPAVRADEPIRESPGPPAPLRSNAVTPLSARPAVADGPFSTEAGLPSFLVWQLDRYRGAHAALPPLVFPTRPVRYQPAAAERPAA